MARRHHLPHLALIQVAVDARVPANRLRMVDCLSRLAAEDPTFHVCVDADSGMVVLSGMSEAHIKAKADALKAAPLEVVVGAPQVYLRECVIRPQQIDYAHKLQRGAKGEFARVVILFAPGADGSGVVVTEGPTIRGALLDAHISGVRKGLAAAFDNGVVAGFPFVDTEATLVDGAYHELDSNEATFQIAARAAFRELKDTGAIGLLEPVMRVAVTCPPACSAAVVRDLDKRRAEDVKELTALVGLEAMFGYEQDLGERTGNRGAFTLTYDHHREVDNDGGPWRFRPAMAKRA